VRTERGEERVVSIDIWSETVALRSTGGELRSVSLDELKTEVGQPRGRQADSDARDES